MSNDIALAEELERAARSLRAAAFAVRSLGGSAEDVARIVADGEAAAAALPGTASYRARIAAMGVVPSGEPLPPPPLQLVRNDERPGQVGRFQVPVLHPSTRHIADAA